MPPGKPVTYQKLIEARLEAVEIAVAALLAMHEDREALMGVVAAIQSLHQRSERDRPPSANYRELRTMRLENLLLGAEALRLGLHQGNADGEEVVS